MCFFCAECRIKWQTQFPEVLGILRQNFPIVRPGSAHVFLQNARESNSRLPFMRQSNKLSCCMAFSPHLNVSKVQLKQASRVSCSTVRTPFTLHCHEALWWSGNCASNAIHDNSSRTSKCAGSEGKRNLPCSAFVCKGLNDAFKFLCQYVCVIGNARVATTFGVSSPLFSSLSNDFSPTPLASARKLATRGPKSL